MPEDVSVMGFDNIPTSEFYHPSLTTIEQNYFKMSEAIFDYFSNIQNTLKKEEIRVKTRLVIRSSVK